MSSQKNRMDYKVYPLWQFMSETYGIEEAFSNFGPYRGAGVTPKIIDKNSIEVSMPLTVDNTNYVGSHFGGSLYSMCDPFYMFLLIWNLGEEYIVWDKNARIDFISPGYGVVKVKFYLPDSEFEEVKQIVAKSRKTTRFYSTEILDERGKVVARLEKELYIRMKK